MRFSYEDFIKEDMKYFPKVKPRSIKKNYEEEKDVNMEACRKCQGYCCKTCGCHFSPDDFEKISFRYLKKEIEKGYISIAYIADFQSKQGTGVFILRIRNFGAPVDDIKDSGMGGCILLTENGCPLSYKNRPSGGKLLIPQEGEVDELEMPNCKSKYTLQQCCYEWLPYKKLLYKVYRYFKLRKVEYPKS